MSAAAAGAMVAVLAAVLAQQPPTTATVDENVLREYAGVYQWGPDQFVYLQMWDEFAGLVAVDESGDVRRLYPTDTDRFFTGPGVALPHSTESRVVFLRNTAGKITSLEWIRGSAPPRQARRVEIERHEDVHFENSDVQLAGTLIVPKGSGKHPAIILVHGSGPRNRHSMLPFARFLVRRGVAILGYDKRGVGGSTGDWNTANFEDLAGDVVAAFQHLKTRPEIDPKQIGLLGVSQAGWIMPLVAVRAPGIAFLISVSGAGVPVTETTIDHARKEMAASGMPPRTIDQVIDLMKLQLQFARTGEGWEAYAAARGSLAARMGQSKTFPANPDDPQWEFIRRLYFYDPAPVLRQLRTPTLAIFGELDNNILAEKNSAAWEEAMKASGNPDYTSRILPKANHLQLEAKIGSNAEMASLQRFVPGYFNTIEGWLSDRIAVLRPLRKH